MYVCVSSCADVLPKCIPPTDVDSHFSSLCDHSVVGVREVMFLESFMDVVSELPAGKVACKDLRNHPLYRDALQVSIVTIAYLTMVSIYYTPSLF